MPYPDRRIGFVDVLTTCTTCPKCIPLKIGRIDFHFDILVDQRMYKNGSKRSHSFSLSIERTHSYQTMDPIFAFQHTKRIVSIDLKGYRFRSEERRVGHVETTWSNA